MWWLDQSETRPSKKTDWGKKDWKKCSLYLDIVNTVWESLIHLKSFEVGFWQEHKYEKIKQI